MGTQLIQIVAFTNVGVGATVPLPHNINVNGRRLIPDFVEKSNLDFSIDSVTDTTVTVTNNGAAPANCNVWLEHKHTIQRWFGNAQTQALVPQPFIPGSAGGGGGATVTTDDTLVGDGSIADPISRRARDYFYGLEDFLTDATWVPQTVGGPSAIIDQGQFGVFNSLCGTVRLRMEADAAGGSVFCSPDIITSNGWCEAGGVAGTLFRCEWRVASILNGPVANPDFLLRASFAPAGAFAPGNNHTALGQGFHFFASFTANANSNWWVSTNNAIDKVDTGVAVNDIQVLAVTYNEVTKDAQFFIDGVLVATINRNFAPRGAPGVSLLAINIGFDTPEFLCDYAEVAMNVDRSVST